MKNLAKVKKEIGTLTKNSKNPFFKSQYLDLNEIIEHVEPLLNDNGILLLQPLKDGLVKSQLWDVNEGYLIAESELKIPEHITDPQKIGACITYFRRYTLKSLLGIAEEDDDGNTAAKKLKNKVSTEKTLEEITIRSCKTVDELKELHKAFSEVNQNRYEELFFKMKKHLNDKKGEKKNS